MHHKTRSLNGPGLSLDLFQEDLGSITPPSPGFPQRAQTQTVPSTILTYATRREKAVKLETCALVYLSVLDVKTCFYENKPLHKLFYPHKESLSDRRPRHRDYHVAYFFEFDFHIHDAYIGTRLMGIITNSKVRAW